MSETKLKPCPFCGCKNIQFWETDNDTHRFQIVCMQCFNGTDECISEEVAMEQWNRRTPMANILEKLEEKHIDISGNTSLHYLYSEGYIDALDYVSDIVKQEINNGLE